MIANISVSMCWKIYFFTSLAKKSKVRVYDTVSNFFFVTSSYNKRIYFNESIIITGRSEASDVDGCLGENGELVFISYKAHTASLSRHFAYSNLQ